MDNETAEELGLKQLGWEEEPDGPRRQSRQQKLMEQKHLRNLLDSSSVSGLPKIVSASNLCSRLFWTILLIVGIIGFIVNMYYITARYISIPILNVNTQEYEEFIWPDIVVCNPMNPLPFWRHQDLVEKWKKASVKANRLGAHLRYLQTYEHSIIMSSMNLRDFDAEDPTNMFPLWMYQLSLTPMQPKNSFYQSMQSSMNFAGFHSIYHTMVFPFPCYKISIPSIPVFKAKHRLSKLDGLSLLVIMAEKSYEIFNCRHADRGLYIYIVPQKQTITATPPEIVSPGGILNSKIYMHRTERLKQKTNCIDEPFKVEIFDASMSHSHVYKGSYDDCVNYASQEIFLRECKCYNPIFPIHRSSQNPPKLCLNMTLFSDREVIANAACLERTFDLYKDSKNFSDILKKTCSKYSRPLCNELQYSIKSSQTVMTDQVNDARRQMLMRAVRSFSYKELRSNLTTAVRNVATIKFFKGSKTGSHATQEEEYTASQFISDIGGIVGLWVGLSVVGLFELVEIVYAVILLVCAKVGQRQAI